MQSKSEYEETRDRSFGSSRSKKMISACFDCVLSAVATEVAFMPAFLFCLQSKFKQVNEMSLPLACDNKQLNAFCGVSYSTLPPS